MQAHGTQGMGIDMRSGCVSAIGTRSAKVWRETLKVSRESRLGLNVLEKTQKGCFKSVLS